MNMQDLNKRNPSSPNEIKDTVGNNSPTTETYEEESCKGNRGKKSSECFERVEQDSWYDITGMREKNDLYLLYTESKNKSGEDNSNKDREKEKANEKSMHSKYLPAPHSVSTNFLHSLNQGILNNLKKKTRIPNLYHMNSLNMNFHNSHKNKILNKLGKTGNTRKGSFKLDNLSYISHEYKPNESKSCDLQYYNTNLVKLKESLQENKINSLKKRGNKSCTTNLKKKNFSKGEDFGITKDGINHFSKNNYHEIKWSPEAESTLEKPNETNILGDNQENEITKIKSTYGTNEKFAQDEKNYRDTSPSIINDKEHIKNITPYTNSLQRLSQTFTSDQTKMSIPIMEPFAQETTCSFKTNEYSMKPNCLDMQKGKIKESGIIYPKEVSFIIDFKFYEPILMKRITQIQIYMENKLMNNIYISEYPQNVTVFLLPKTKYTVETSCVKIKNKLVHMKDTTILKFVLFHNEREVGYSYVSVKNLLCLGIESGVFLTVENGKSNVSRDKEKEKKKGPTNNFVVPSTCITTNGISATQEKSIQISEMFPFSNNEINIFSPKLFVRFKITCPKFLLDTIPVHTVIKPRDKIHYLEQVIIAIYNFISNSPLLMNMRNARVANIVSEKKNKKKDTDVKDKESPEETEMEQVEKESFVLNFEDSIQNENDTNNIIDHLVEINETKETNKKCDSKESGNEDDTNEINSKNSPENNEDNANKINKSNKEDSSTVCTPEHEEPTICSTVEVNEETIKEEVSNLNNEIIIIKKEINKEDVIDPSISHIENYKQKNTHSLKTGTIYNTEKNNPEVTNKICYNHHNHIYNNSSNEDKKNIENLNKIIEGYKKELEKKKKQIAKLKHDNKNLNILYRSYYRKLIEVNLMHLIEEDSLFKDCHFLNYEVKEETSSYKNLKSNKECAILKSIEPKKGTNEIKNSFVISNQTNKFITTKHLLKNNKHVGIKTNDSDSSKSKADENKNERIKAYLSVLNLNSNTNKIMKQKKKVEDQIKTFECLEKWESTGKKEKHRKEAEMSENERKEFKELQREIQLLKEEIEQLKQLDVEEDIEKREQDEEVISYTDSEAMLRNNSTNPMNEEIPIHITNSNCENQIKKNEKTTGFEREGRFNLPTNLIQNK